MKAYRCTPDGGETWTFVKASNPSKAKATAIRACESEGLECNWFEWTDWRVLRVPELDRITTLTFEDVFSTGWLGAECVACGGILSNEDEGVYWGTPFSAACNETCWNRNSRVNSPPPGYPDGIVVYMNW